jgi:hypothetical protein
MEIIYSLPYLALIIWLLPKIPFFRNSGLTPLTLRALISLKALTGIGLVMVYTYYYPVGSSDIFNYFQDGKVLHSALSHSPNDYFRMLLGINDQSPHLMYYYDQMDFWLKDFNYDMFNDNRTVIRFNALVMIFSLKNIYVHTYIMNVLALIGLIGIYRFLTSTLHINKIISLIAIALPPSLLFWGSGLLKEGIVLFALGLLVFGIYQINKNSYNVRPYITLAFSLLIFSISKFYVLLAISPAIISFFVNKKIHKPILVYSIIHLVLYLSIFLLPLIDALPNIPQVIANKQNDFINFVHSLNHVGSYIETPILTSNIIDFTLQGLRGFFVTLFRPHLLEVHNFAALPAALENLITIGLITIIPFARNRHFKLNYLLFGLSFTLILFALSGMTTPVLGALVRYKIPAQPFLYAILLMSINWTWLERRFKLASGFEKIQNRIFTQASS